ncbi:unnamed protein product [Somion occarium]|uniref:Uncharacterized protein n=1 Tax=Somion occarium TaxID=3059160 RepID=A0ABP1DQU1_9APHY
MCGGSHGNRSVVHNLVARSMIQALQGHDLISVPYLHIHITLKHRLLKFHYMTMTDPPACGVAIQQDNGLSSYLPLEESQVQARIVDGIVILTQVFSNHGSRHKTSQTRYVFPIPARGAVCAFQMQTEDGRVIRGIAKERNQAAAEHAQAIQAGKLTSLVEWSTDDVFTISLGPVPGGQRIRTMLTYVLDLLDDDAQDRIRFQLPTYIGARYGDVPRGVLGGMQADSRTRVTISVVIQTQGEVINISSPTHCSIIVTSGKYGGKVVVFKSQFFLQEDFVLSIDAEGLDGPRGFVERHPTRTDSIAMQLTVLPRFTLPPIPSQEYIFLVDCSGSMRGARITTAKESLAALLRSLPQRGTMFNVIRFGSSCVKLFTSSKVYCEGTFGEADKFINGTDADLGGTEIRTALQQVFRSRNTSIPTAVFVLTDGEAYDIDATISDVSKEAEKAKENARLRVFTLGIGSTASSAMCEGIARAGNGVCLMTATTEGIPGKCAKLVTAAKSYLLRNISIEWGVPSSDVSPFGRRRGEEATVQQVPERIETLYPGLRFIAFALIRSARGVLPREVVVRGQRDGAGEVIEMRIPVTESCADKSEPPLIHTLAAKRLITELQDDRGNRGQILSEEDKEVRTISLGTEYQLASRYTSFIAVEDGKEITSPYHDKSSHYAAEEYRTRSGFSRITMDPQPPTATRTLKSFCESYDGSEEEYSSHPKTTQQERGWEARGRSTPPQSFGSAPRPPAAHGGIFRKFSFRNPLSVISRSSSRDVLPLQASPALPEGFRPRGRKCPVTTVVPPPTVPVAQSSSSTAKPNTIQPTQDDVFALIRLQSFKGSFPMSEKFIQIVGQAAASLYHDLHIEKDSWTTILAIAYLQKYLKRQPELLQSLVEKAAEFVSGNGLPAGLDFNVLLDRAKNVI